jgi:type I restriction enzyme S subunit
MQRPMGWHVVKFGDVVTCVNGTTRDPITEGLSRIVGLDHMDSESLPLRRWDLLNDLPDGTSFTRIFRAGQVLFGKRRVYQRKVSVPEFDGICSGDILVFEATSPKMLQRYLPYLVQSNGFFEHALGTSAGSLSPRTKWQELAKYEFALPSVDEQYRIIDLMVAIDTVSDCYQSVPGEELFTATLEEIFSPPNRDWNSSLLGDVAEVQLGRMLSAERASGSDLAPYIKNNNVQWDGIDLADLPTMSFPVAERSRYELRAGDILVCEGGDPGRSFLLKEDIKNIYYQKAVHRVRTDKLLPQYLHFWLIHSYRNGAMRQLCTGTAIVHLPAIRFRQLRVNWPNLTKQHEIVERLFACQNLLATQRVSLAKIQTLRVEILNKIMAGEIHVQ